MKLANYLGGLPAKFGWFIASVYIISQVSIGLILGPVVGPTLIKMQLAFTRHRFLSVVDTWNAHDLIRFKQHFYLDFIHPLWYGLLLAWMLAKTLPSNRRALVWIPVAASICDVLENIVHAVPAFKGTFPLHHQPLLAAGSTFAAAKWSLVVVSVSLVVAFFIRKRFMKKKP